ncbi:methyl-CpG-binding domain-containing protein 3 isoform X2 [Capsella rubella]|uniref:methyl-CpG-binding domain-containing protein 3 isoform X2 n=1 Tax=Capsella rubella TaxID=81985 RepID=UPI000CD53130|nr:methyl-CpG-binding domain-containing protein 3 isoform X2 [Capsella rubella]
MQNQWLRVRSRRITTNHHQHHSVDFQSLYSKTTKTSSSPSKLEIEKKTQATSTKKPSMTTLIDSYAVQCAKCKKLRYIEAQEKYEEIRSKSPHTCFECKSCEELGDVHVDVDSPNVRWFLDQHGIPKTPKGWKRILVVRGNGEKVDVYYETPQQKKVRSPKQVAKFIQDNEEFKDDVKMEEISFVAPKRMKKPKS